MKSYIESKEPEKTEDLGLVLATLFRNKVYPLIK